MIFEEKRKKLEPFVLLLLRFVVGLIFAVHGWEKLQNPAPFVDFVTSLGVPLPEINAYLAIFSEFIGGLALIAGLFTPLASLGLSVTMVVAITTVHLSNGLLAKNNGFEYPLTLLAVCIFFIVRGAGCLSLDALIGKKFCKKNADAKLYD